GDWRVSVSVSPTPCKGLDTRHQTPDTAATREMRRPADECESTGPYLHRTTALPTGPRDSTQIAPLLETGDGRAGKPGTAPPGTPRATIRRAVAVGPISTVSAVV